MLRLKENQPATLAAVTEWFEQATSPPQSELTPLRLTEKGHGRLVTYTIQATTALNAFLEQELHWPRVGQVLRIDRRCIQMKTGEVTHKTHYAITDLLPQQADPLTVFRLWHQHWHIENKLHWVRDVPFAEDRCLARTGAVPFNLSLLRNAVISLLRLYGYDSVTQARSYFAGNVQAACSLVGIPLE